MVEPAFSDVHGRCRITPVRWELARYGAVQPGVLSKGTLRHGG